MKISKAIAWLAALGLLMSAGLAQAHDPRPVTVNINESLPDIFRVSVRAPDTVERANQPELRWPAKCSSLQQQARSGQSVRCPGGLEGELLTLVFPQFNPSLGTYYQLTNLEGGVRKAMIPPTEESWVVPVPDSPAGVAWSYMVLGIEHIIGGLDHLLFVLGLLVIAGTVRRILWTITGFTLAHSITLSLSSLGLIAVPITPVEAGIALSILFLAVEIGQNKQDTLTYRYPLIVSFLFGLLHGLGFASALGEIGLAAGEVVVSLLFFNIGVELGQIAFILVVLAAISVIRRLVQRFTRIGATMLKQRTEWLAAYLVGIPSAYWLIDRLSFLY